MRKQDIFNPATDVVSISHTGNVRKENEDSFGYALTPNGHVFVVCDGMGGHVGGKEASETAVHAIMEFLSRKTFADIPTAIREAVQYANRAVYEKALQNPHLRGMGTTVVMAVIKDDKVYIGHAGDSRIYLFTDGNLIQLTKDHSLVQKLYEMGIISREDMRTHPRKNEITRALGLKPDIQPDVPQEPLLLKNNDILLLCTDGLTDMADDETIRKILAESPGIKEAGQKLLRHALQAGGKDNITLQLIKITNSNYKETIYPGKEKTSIHDDITLIDENNTYRPQQTQTRISPAEFLTRSKIIGLIALLSLLSIAWWLWKRSATDTSRPPTVQTEQTEKTKPESIQTEDAANLPDQNRQQSGESKSRQRENSSSDKNLPSKKTAKPQNHENK